MLAAAALLGFSVAAATFWLPLRASAVLGGYLAVTLVYSFYLKRRPIADILALASLFTSRILAGSWLLPVPASPWLISFSLLFFLSLAEVKRYAELLRVVSEGGDRIDSRNYSAEDLPLLISSGVGSALASTVIFTVYLIEEQYPRHIYSHPHWLWAMLPMLLGWLLRVWRKAAHGQMNEDPVLFALGDRVSLGLAVMVGLIIVAAWV
jgi:4-hydroxybenzoate polyprenyltransferase